MLIKINPDTYINPECVEAVQKQSSYVGDSIKDYAEIYTRGGGRFCYDGTLEECIEKLKKGTDYNE
jgi:hypothetical protein